MPNVTKRPEMVNLQIFPVVGLVDDVPGQSCCGTQRAAKQTRVIFRIIHTPRKRTMQAVALKRKCGAISSAKIHLS
jgi:hypothetical protein